MSNSYALYSSENKEVIEFTIPEGQGQRVRVKLRHSGLQNSKQCMTQSESLYYSYKDPIISRIKASPKNDNAPPTPSKNKICPTGNTDETSFITLSSIANVAIATTIKKLPRKFSF